ncbi:MAG: serine/threonine protein kinase, partial [Thermoanaerobaculia bacterium]|nr:serine/threonine protein kinase [Thermoanaerobaculia bacterium]
MSSQPSERTGALSGADHDVPSRIGPYRVERRLGRGGMGEVWSAFDDRLGRRVALKRVLEGTTNPRAKARLRLEARSLAKLSHPSIVKIHDWIELEHDTWFVMEFVNGRTLDHWKPGSLPDVDWVVRIGARIALGLAAAHGSGVVHRDLKLSNVMITDAGQVKILDFGLAKRLDQRAVQSLTGDRHVLGSAGSMAPEQILGGEVDGRTDLFAFGVLLYRLLLGVPPFAGTSTLRVLKSTCADPHPALRPTRPEIPQPLEELIDRLLAKDRTDRPDGAAEVADLLHAMAAQDGDSGLQSGQRDSNDLQAERIPVAILLMKAGSTTELAAAREAFEAVVDELSGVVEDAPDDR